MAAVVPEDEHSGPYIARRLGVDAATVRKWRREGCPAEVYNAKMIRYRLSEVQAWLRYQRRKGSGV
jgi:hypothetical protein